MGTIVLFIIIILIVVDVFLTYEIPTHLAYLLSTIFIVLILNYSIIHKGLIGMLIWFGFIIFHYLVWRKFIEKIHDKIIAPRKHTAGIEGLIGKRGVIKEIDSVRFLLINEELYEFEHNNIQEIEVGNSYEILQTKSNKLII